MLWRRDGRFRVARPSRVPKRGTNRALHVRLEMIRLRPQPRLAVQERVHGHAPSRDGARALVFAVAVAVARDGVRLDVDAPGAGSRCGSG